MKATTLSLAALCCLLLAQATQAQRLFVSSQAEYMQQQRTSRRALRQYGYDSGFVGAEEAPSQWVSVDSLPPAPAPAPAAGMPFPAVSVRSLSIDDTPGSPSHNGGYVGPTAYSPLPASYSPLPVYASPLLPSPAPSTGRRLQQDRYGYDSSFVGAEEAPSQWVSVDSLPPAPAPAPGLGMPFPSVSVRSLSIDGNPGYPLPSGGYMGPTAYSPLPASYSPLPVYASPLLPSPAPSTGRRLQQDRYGYDSWSVVGAEEAPTQWIQSDFSAAAPAPAPALGMPFPSVSVRSLSMGEGVQSMGGPQGYVPIAAYAPPPAYAPAPFSQ